MSRIKLVLMFLLIIVVLTGRERKNALIHEFGVPYYSFDVVATPLTDWKNIRISILIEIPFDALQFVKEKNEFVARYEISILVFNEEEAQVISRIWKDEIRTEEFGKTNSTQDFKRSEIQFDLLPGIYQINIGVMDLDSRKTGHREKVINLKDFYTADVVLGNIQLLEKGRDKERAFVPSISNAVSDSDSVLYFQYHLLSRCKHVAISWRIEDKTENVILEDSFEREVSNGALKDMVIVPKSRLSFKPYILIVEADCGGRKVSRRLPFKVRWIGMSSLINNLDEAIQQLRYIANGSEINRMLRADKDQKKELFIRFWKRMDPTPDTEINELMNEYYRRVEYANEHFSGFTEGWQTDMGMIFILFGPPSDIERHPFNIGTKPYEIWYYYEINRYFIFVDESGFGEYRLITPINDPNQMY